jgi:hypothetical protein
VERCPGGNGLNVALADQSHQSQLMLLLNFLTSRAFGGYFDPIPYAVSDLWKLSSQRYGGGILVHYLC